MKGWVKIQRGIIRHRVFQDAEEFKLWVYLLLKAEHKPRNITVNNKIFRVERGQVYLSYSQISIDCHIDITKLKRIIARLKQERMVTTTINDKRTLITVINFNKHQANNEHSWIKIKRATLGHYIFGDPEYLKCWLYMLIKAEHSSKIRRVNDSEVKVERGQHATTYTHLQAATGISRRMLQKIFLFLKNNSMMDTRDFRKFTLFTITNFNKHQQSEPIKIRHRYAGDTRGSKNRQLQANFGAPKKNKNYQDKKERKEKENQYVPSEQEILKKREAGRVTNHPASGFAINELAKKLSSDTKPQLPPPVLNEVKVKKVYTPEEIQARTDYFIRTGLIPED